MVGSFQKRPDKKRANDYLTVTPWLCVLGGNTVAVIFDIKCLYVYNKNTVHFSNDKEIIQGRIVMKKRRGVYCLFVLTCISVMGLTGCGKKTSEGVRLSEGKVPCISEKLLKSVVPEYKEADKEYTMSILNYQITVDKEKWEDKKDELTGARSADEFLFDGVKLLLDMQSNEKNSKNKDTVKITLLEDSGSDNWGLDVVKAALGTSSNLTLQEGMAVCALSDLEMDNSISFGEDIHKLCANYCLDADLIMSHIGVWESECNYNKFPGTKWKYRVMSASFCRYLADTYGQDALLELYHSKDDAYEKYTGKSLSELKDEWVASLSNYKAMSEEDLDHLRKQWYASKELDNPYEVERPVKVACVGDSITYGTLLENRDATNYPLVMDALLGEGYTVGNFGNPGSTLMNSADEPYRYSWECNASKEFDGDIVVMMLGTNDTKGINWKGIDTFAESYEAAIKEYESLPAKPQIYLCTPCAGLAATYDIRPDRIEEIAEFVKEYGKKHGYPVIDMHSMTEDNWDIYVWDGIHPNVEGARMMAEKVAMALISEGTEE